MSDQTNAVSVSVGIETKDKILFHLETVSLPFSYLIKVSMSQLITVNYTPQKNLPITPTLSHFLYIVQLGLTFTFGFTD